MSTEATVKPQTLLYFIVQHIIINNCGTIREVKTKVGYIEMEMSEYNTNWKWKMIFHEIIMISFCPFSYDGTVYRLSLLFAL